HDLAAKGWRRDQIPARIVAEVLLQIVVEPGGVGVLRAEGVPELVGDRGAQVVDSAGAIAPDPVVAWRITARQAGRRDRPFLKRQADLVQELACGEGVEKIIGELPGDLRPIERIKVVGLSQEIRGTYEREAEGGGRPRHRADESATEKQAAERPGDPS